MCYEFGWLVILGAALIIVALSYGAGVLIDKQQDFTSLQRIAMGFITLLTISMCLCMLGVGLYALNTLAPDIGCFFLGH